VRAIQTGPVFGRISPLGAYLGQNFADLATMLSRRWQQSLTAPRPLLHASHPPQRPAPRRQPAGRQLASWVPSTGQLGVNWSQLPGNWSTRWQLANSHLSTGKSSPPRPSPHCQLANSHHPPASVPRSASMPGARDNAGLTVCNVHTYRAVLRYIDVPYIYIYIIYIYGWGCICTCGCIYIGCASLPSPL
jgi:hypothetical protein